MRKVFILFYLFPILLSAQNIPLIEDGKVWHMETYPFTETDLPLTYEGYSYELKGDTLINDKLYNLVYYRDEWYHWKYDGDKGGANLDDPPVLIGCIREDTLAQRVYYINWYTDQFISCWRFDIPINEELLLYDFGIEIGDTINYDFDLQDYHYILENKENYTLNNGEETILYTFKNGLSWLGAIGGYEHDHGLFGPISPFNFEGGCVLECVQKDSTYYLEGGYCGTLPDHLVGINEDLAPIEDVIDVKIFPIPVSDELNVIVDSESTFSYQIYDTRGVAISKKRKSNSNKVVEKLSYLNSGIYILKVFLEKGRTFSSKFVKN